MRGKRFPPAAIITLLACTVLAWGAVPSLPVTMARRDCFGLLNGISDQGPPPPQSPATGQTIVGDADENGVPEEYSLQSARLVVRTAGGVIWQTPPAWQVTQCLIGDATGDGKADILLSVWKTGSFGPQKPFWVSGDDDSYRNHLFIFNLVNGTVKSVWQSSNLDRPNHAVLLSDLDRDGRNELVAFEGCYDNFRAVRITVWQWNGWGFTRQQ